MSLNAFPVTPPTLVIGAALYALPKVGLWLSAHPGHSIQLRVDQLREKWISFRDKARTLLGEKVWHLLTDVVLKNLWLAYLILKYVNGNTSFFTTIEKTIYELYALFTLCASIWVIKELSRRKCFGY